jgi:hypothetical protein
VTLLQQRFAKKTKLSVPVPLLDEEIPPEWLQATPAAKKEVNHSPFFHY